MAYRVVSESAPGARRGARHRHGDRTLTRNAGIAAASLLSVSLVAAGAVIFGGSCDFEAPARQIASHRSFRIALVDPAPPKVIRRDPRIAIATPGPHLLRVAVANIPLPVPRPTQMAAAPLAPERLADADITGSIGQPSHATVDAEAKAIALAYAPIPSPRPSPRRGEGEKGTELKHHVVSAPPKPPHRLTPFEKLYGPVHLASLTPADTGRADDSDPEQAPYDRHTAVYVISSKKVYLPDGRVLEAHSGLGDKLDDPRYVKVRMRGATPPHMYDLKLRERLFHGVEAIRLTPAGGNEAIFGRAGLLAHSYMLGPNGQSNGCVSFRDYEAFLRAYKSGEITRLAVIARLD